MINKEIERKFLVRNNNFKSFSFKQEEIVQGFLSSVPERNVRVRIKGNTGFITIKGKSNTSGTTRFEWEKIISKEEAKELLKICEPKLIIKTRFNVKYRRHIFEVDEFYGDNEGLIIAEIELMSENEFFEKPEWLGEEVTGDVKYYNSQLKNNPYSNWKQVDIK